MPYHLIEYRVILDIPTSLVSSYRVTPLDNTKDGYLALKASTTIPPLLNSVLCKYVTSFTNRSAKQSGTIHERDAVSRLSKHNEVVLWRNGVTAFTKEGRCRQG